MKKLKLNEIGVKSFVTAMDNASQQRANGGLTMHGPACSNNVCDPVQTARTCPNGQTGSENPCYSAVVVCNGNTNSPCSGAGTVCCSGIQTWCGNCT